MAAVRTGRRHVYRTASRGRCPLVRWPKIPTFGGESRMRKALGLVALAALMTAGSAAGIVTARGDASPQAANASIRLKGVATEYKFAVSRRSVPAGAALDFNGWNKGQDAPDPQER